MPLYRYRCEDCGNIMQVLEGVGRDEGEVKCRNCGSKNLIRLLPQTLSVKSSETAQGECCGMTTPCDNPKRCCQNF